VKTGVSSSSSSSATPFGVTTIGFGFASSSSSGATSSFFGSASSSSTSSFFSNAPTLTIPPVPAENQGLSLSPRPPHENVVDKMPHNLSTSTASSLSVKRKQKSGENIEGNTGVVPIAVIGEVQAEKKIKV
jgi:transglutaminase/protease-like cytokinesis protein 3